MNSDDLRRALDEEGGDIPDPNAVRRTVLDALHSDSTRLTTSVAPHPATVRTKHRRLYPYLAAASIAMVAIGATYVISTAATPDTTLGSSPTAHPPVLSSGSSAGASTDPTPSATGSSTDPVPVSVAAPVTYPSACGGVFKVADHQDNGLTVTASKSPEQAYTLLEVTLTNPTEDRIKGVDGWTLYALDDDDVVIGMGGRKADLRYVDLAAGEQTTVERVVGQISDCNSKGSYLQADKVRLVYRQTVTAPGPERVAEGAVAVSTP